MIPFQSPLAWLGNRDGELVVGHGPFSEAAEPPTTGIAFYVQDFELSDPQPWKIPASFGYVAADQFAAAASEAPPLITWTAPAAAPFAEVFHEVMRAIHSGEFEKTVPVVTEQGVASSPPESWVIPIMQQGPPLRSYGWITSQSGFCGATPEQLFELNGTRLATMALAGTARSEDRDVFDADEKEIREHEYVAQSLVSKLFDVGRLTRSSREILDLGSIVHFLTRIEVELYQALQPADLVRRLHPTPALGPLPRTSETLKQLAHWRERLNCPRGFGAPFGVWDHGRFEAVVAIRGIWWSDHYLALPTGCGCIEASRLVNEWRELRLKREAVKSFLCDPGLRVAGK